MKFSKFWGAFAAVNLLVASAFFVSCHSDDDSTSHEHTFATEWKSDATHHWHAATCEHTDEVKDKVPHNFGEWETTKTATEEADGSKKRECETCHYAVTEIIPALEHNHKISTEWTYDNDYHWHAADCGREEHNEGKAVHTWTDGDITKAATETEDGEQALTCECGATSSKVIPALGHNHEIAKTYTSDETHHWYAADCGREEHNEGKAAHNFVTSVKKAPTCTEKGINTETCSECNYSKDVDGELSSENHEGTATWKATAETHIETYDCCGAVKTEEAAHTWNDGEVTKTPTTTEEGEKTYTCEICKHTKTEAIEKLPDFNAYEQPIDVETNKIATASSKYIYFGVFPKTVLSETSGVTVDETKSIEMGANTYYKGNDGNYYAKVKESAYGTGTEYKYSDASQAKQSSANSYRYFKVEPIKWKVLTTDYNNTGKALLLAEDILTGNVPYYVSSSNRTIGGSTVYANNYKYSTIRAYLNGKYESDDTQSKTAYENKGFLQTAFTSTAQSLIAENAVDNSADSTTDNGNNISKATSYACANTTDKIFLLSEKEVTTSAYGFASYSSYGQGNARIRVPTDYAKANYASQSSTAGYGGMWWLRSPLFYINYYARSVYYNGSADAFDYVDDRNGGGVVPALSISF